MYSCIFGVFSFKKMLYSVPRSMNDINIIISIIYAYDWIAKGNVKGIVAHDVAELSLKFCNFIQHYWRLLLNINALWNSDFNSIFQSSHIISSYLFIKKFDQGIPHLSVHSTVLQGAHSIVDQNLFFYYTRLLHCEQHKISWLMSNLEIDLCS